MKWETERMIDNDIDFVQALVSSIVLWMHFPIRKMAWKLTARLAWM